MAKSFTIPKRAYQGLNDLIDMGPEKVERLAREVTDRDLTLDLSALVKKLAAAVDFAPERLEHAIHAVLFPLNTLRAAFSMSPPEFLRLLEGEARRQNPDWYKAHADG